MREAFHAFLLAIVLLGALFFVRQLLFIMGDHRKQKLERRKGKHYDD